MIDNSILIIGKGDTEFFRGRAQKFFSTAEVIRYFGVDSELTVAYKEAVSLGADNIYLFNATMTSDYVLAMSEMSLRDFKYIVPLNSLFDVHLGLNSNISNYLAEDYSRSVEDKYSKIIYTSQKSNLYENLEHFIKDISKKVRKFKKNTRTKVFGENILFVANNLQKYEFANVVLAATLARSNFKTYPSMNVGDVHFDLTSNDFIGLDIIFHGYNKDMKTTIENFYNFCNLNVPVKYVPVSEIVNIINDALDLDDFKGAVFTPYTKVLIENQANQILNSFVGGLIERFKVLNVEIFRNQRTKEVSIQVHVSIKLNATFEEIKFIKKV